MKLSQLSNPRPDLHLIDVLVERLAQQQGECSAYQSTILKKARKAIHAGNLSVCDPETGFLIGDSKEPSPLTKVEYFNDWLKSCGGPILRETTKVEPAAAEFPATSTESVAQQPAPNTKALHHTSKDQRRNILRPVIEHAQSLCKDPWDTAEVWGQMHKLANDQYLVLLHCEDSAIAYTDGDQTKLLMRKNLADRLRRRRDK
jgi:hypothetical protein